MKLTERCFSLLVLSLVSVAQVQVVSAQAVTIAENLRLPIAIECSCHVRMAVRARR